MTGQRYRRDRAAPGLLGGQSGHPAPHSVVGMALRDDEVAFLSVALGEKHVVVSVRELKGGS